MINKIMPATFLAHLFIALKKMPADFSELEEQRNTEIK